MLVAVFLGVGALLGRAAPRSGVARMGATAAPFRPDNRALISEPAAVWALDQMQVADVSIETAELQAVVPTTFYRPLKQEQEGPVILFLHGADFSCLEWRFVIQALTEQGFDCAAVDWWSGGWTERAQITRRLERGDGVEPWTLVRQHIAAFVQQQLDGRPVILVGASLGGAVAIDFASSYAELVDALVLIDAGGESYKAPPPDQVALAAEPVLAIKSAFQAIQKRIPTQEAQIVSMHRSQPGVYGASLAYLKAGGIARRVGRERIRQLQQPTLVIWGEDDDILPLKDAFAFERDLQRCKAIKVVENAGHSPHLDRPQEVIAPLAAFAAQQRRGTNSASQT